jgi:hypothetical protein
MEEESKNPWLAPISTVLSLRALVHLKDSSIRYEQDNTEALPLEWFVEQSYALRLRMLKISKDLEALPNLHVSRLARFYLEVDHARTQINQLKKESLYLMDIPLEKIIHNLDYLDASWKKIEAMLTSELELQEVEESTFTAHLEAASTLCIQIIQQYEHHL